MQDLCHWKPQSLVEGKWRRPKSIKMQRTQINHGTFFKRKRWIDLLYGYQSIIKWCITQGSPAEATECVYADREVYYGSLVTSKSTKSRAGRLDTQERVTVESKGKFADRIPSFLGEVSLCSVKSFNWLDEATHIRKGHLHYSKTTHLCVHLIFKNALTETCRKITKYLSTMAQPSWHKINHHR